MVKKLTILNNKIHTTDRNPIINVSQGIFITIAVTSYSLTNATNLMFFSVNKE